MNEIQPIYTLKEVCAALRISKATLWRWQREGRFPRSVKLSPGRCGYPKSVIDDFMDGLCGAGRIAGEVLK